MRPIIGLLLLWLASSGFAADGLARLRLDQPVEYRYQEARKLALLNAPWHGSGYLLSTPEGTLLKLQLLPERVIMAIDGNTLYYYESATGRRNSVLLEQAGAMAGPIRTFRAIVQGRSSELDANYSATLRDEAAGWAVRLLAKPGVSTDAPASVELVADRDRRKQTLIVTQADGEESRYRLEHNREGAELTRVIRQLLSEAAGN